MTLTILGTVLLFGLWISAASGFSVSNKAPRQASFITSNSQRRSLTRLFSTQQQDSNDEEDVSFDNYNPVRDEQSQMPDYIASFVESNKDTNEEEAATSYTHMIGVPMDECHELTLELESVQRAILYHCPLLVHACIVPAMTRMPLLYVSAPHKTVATVTKTLHDIVERVVQQTINVQQAPTPVMDPENEEEVMGGINSDGMKPLLMSFENLEIDGPGNQVLHTVAVDNDDGSTRLVQLVNTLKKEIEALGWKVTFPPDEHSSNSNTFRPRVPFMRLPDNFVELLDPLEEGQEDWMRTSDQGGNGISPIFWCQWWEDAMAKNVRLREISVYPRQPNVPDGLGEQAFYIPHETTTLPAGNDALTKAEARHRKYNDDRMAEAEGRTIKDNESSENADTLRDPQVRQQRERLESIYAADDADDAALIDDEVKKEIKETLEAIDVASGEDASSETPVDEVSTKDESSETKEQQEIDDWTKERIRKAVEARAFVQAQKVEQKDKPNIEDNEVFQKYKNNTLVAKKNASNNGKASTKKLPDYPSREHFFGIWRVVTSPTGFPEEAGDATKSDNIILRVDGTIAGGPTLDQQTNQKAAGGTWKMLESSDDDSTKIRIRLVIPPKKERILVMEGEVTRFMSGTEMPLSKSTFGIPELEKAAQKKDDDMEDLMHCGGPVWIEDAVTGKNRDEIGTFSLMKLQSPMEPGKYTITIPRPVRSQD